VHLTEELVSCCPSAPRGTGTPQFLTKNKVHKNIAKNKFCYTSGCQSENHSRWSRVGGKTGKGGGKECSISVMCNKNKFLWHKVTDDMLLHILVLYQFFEGSYCFHLQGGPCGNILLQNIGTYLPVCMAS